MHDILIQGGTVVDGSGAPARQADVAVQDGRIAAVGHGLGGAQRVVDARGLLVTPGFVDIHTHYDGQATWDAFLTPSCWHGVTTAVFGNCGVGFAPVKPGARDYLINLMEGVEDIPGTVLAEGIDWSWESFPEYLDALAQRRYAMDIGAQLPHAALRFFAMGDRGADHQQQPSATELELMARLAEEALHAGALGITTSRTIKHRARDGRYTPSLTAAEPELFAIAAALRRAGKGVLEVNSDFGDGDFEILRSAAEAAGRPMSLLLLQVDNAPGLWRQTLDQIHAARRAGLDVTGQVGAKSIGVLFGFETSRNPFDNHPAWAPLAPLPPAARVQRLRDDTALRQRLVDERPGDALTAWFDQAFKRTFALGPALDYEPDAAQSLAARAQRAGTSAWALALDALLADDGKGMLLHPFENYSGGDFGVVHAMLADSATVMGLGDAGAHVGLICDGAGPTYLLKHWARDRSRGPKLPLEMLVKKQTLDTAGVYGLHDRGLLAAGKKADINVIDFAALDLLPPQVAYDLPTGGRRLLQRARGYRHTFVSGVEVLRDDELTGQTPGRLIRG
jgi:N-acyl-D-aspartate/D-glutamate deacylase